MQAELACDGDSQRLVAFVERNRVLLNMVLRQNPHLLEATFRPMIRVPRCRKHLHFDIKRAFFKARIKKMKQQAGRQFGSLRVAVRRSRVSGE
jgi:hypothetical protein